MGSIAKIAGKAKRIKGRLEAIGNKRRKIIGGFLLIVGLPSWITNANFWFRIGRRGWPVIAWTYNTQVGRLCLTIVGLLLIFFPWQRFKRKSDYDITTLRGRTLKLRDEMQAFLDNSPPSREYAGTTQVGGLQRDTGSSLRVVKLDHGYSLRFADTLMKLFHEYGERGVRDIELAEALNRERQVNNVVFYNTVIGSLGRLANTPEAGS